MPVALIVAGFFLITAFQTERLVQEHSSLVAIQADQATSLEQADKVRTGSRCSPPETAKLAESGNSGAKAVLDQLRAQGVTVRPNAP